VLALALGAFDGDCVPVPLGAQALSSSAPMTAIAIACHPVLRRNM
jgi:hypothetical protein